jgi:hypothetical protein
MNRQVQPALAELFEDDETAWLDIMARLVAERRYDELDHQHLSEYLTDMARSHRREVLSRLTTLMTHLLKWDDQTKKRTRSWRATIRVQRQELQDLLENQSLANYAGEVLPKAYERAVARASDETGLAAEAFPSNCPFTIEALLTTD